MAELRRDFVDETKESQRHMMSMLLAIQDRLTFLEELQRELKESVVQLNRIIREENSTPSILGRLRISEDRLTAFITETHSWKDWRWRIVQDVFKIGILASIAAILGYYYGKVPLK